jgi:hypothetical protein
MLIFPTKKIPTHPSVQIAGLAKWSSRSQPHGAPFKPQVGLSANKKHKFKINGYIFVRAIDRSAIF